MSENKTTEEKIRTKIFNYAKSYGWTLAIVLGGFTFGKEFFGSLWLQSLVYAGIIVAYFAIIYGISREEVRVFRNEKIRRLENESSHFRSELNSCKLNLGNLEAKLLSIKEILPQVFKIHKITIQTDIQNDQGDAKMSSFVELTHLRNVALTEIRHEIKYDGESAREPKEIQIFISGQPTIPVIVANYKKESGEGLQRITKYKIPIANIGPNQRFEYSVSTYYPRLFPHLKSSQLKEVISWALSHETDELELIVNSHTDLIERIFKINDHTGVEDFAEENRIRQANNEPVLVDKRSLKWKIRRPKLGYTYELYFRAPP